MRWYWIALIMGAGIAPWVVMGRGILLAFISQGLSSGLGYWFGTALLTTPIIFAIMWAGLLLIGH